jgi:hypothetical protein
MMTENEIGNGIAANAIHIYRSLGPGLMERVYETIPAHGLHPLGWKVERQVPRASE